MITSRSRTGRRFRVPSRNLFFLVTSILLLLDLYLRFRESLTLMTESTIGPYAMSDSKSEELPTMELPSHISEVFLNIGSNIDPILPPKDSGDKALTIAFEPIVGCKIKPHKQLMVVNAAVAATAGLASMFIYNNNGLSSSLSKPAIQGLWNSDSERDGHIQIVPIITLRQILSAIPQHIAIPYIKTDMQGYDFLAVAAAQDFLFQRKVDYVYTEVYVHNLPSYQGVSNDFCTDWWPHMRRVGYDLVYLYPPTFFSILPTKGLDTKEATEYCAEQIGKAPKNATLHLLNEANALWKRKGAADREFLFEKH